MNARNELSEANRRALHDAHEAGLTVSLCTGRSLRETRSVIEQIGLDLDAGVFVFGAIVSELPEGRTLVRTGLPAPLTDRLMHHLQSRHFPVLALYDPAETGIDYRLVRGERNLAWYEKWLEMADAPCEQLDAWTPLGADPVRLGVIAEPDEIDGTVAALREAFPADQVKFNAIYAPNYRLHVVECFAPQVNKWYGIMQLARRTGIAPAEIVAIGDDVNDLEMIRNAGLGIAMGNAIEPIRNAARWHAPDHNESGVARAIDAVLKGEIPAEPAP